MTLWEPTPERAAGTQLAAFMRAHGFADYRALHAWSVAQPEAFWPALWDELGIIGDRGERVLDRGAALIDARFFPDARLSFAENLLRRRDDAIAIVHVAADGARRTLTFSELAAAVGRCAAHLRSLGIGPGDRVVGALPNGPEAVIAMLGANCVGAIGSLCDLDLGIDAVVDRFGQIEPRVLFARTNGDGDRLCARLPTVEHAITDFDFPDAPLAFERMPFNAPAFILYTSGTTGLPKCIVHNTGGQLLQLAKENRLHYDLRRGDRWFYQTSTGWNMWYWSAIALAAEATIVLREGSPLRPKATALFDLAAAERLTHLGISPPFLAACRDGKLSAPALPALRAVMATGSPLSPALSEYVYRAIKADVHLISLSGGTEINGCFATGDPTGAVHAGELQVPALGMATAVFDDAGHAIVGARGELVCTEPFPSQPVGFWGDHDRTRYRATYFERYPGAWHHGDFAEVTPTGYVIHGRSDATLKPSGHRIGTAEIYRQLETLPAIADAVAVGQQWRDDIRIILFVVLTEGHALDEKAIRAALVRASPYHVPARIVVVPAVPYTRSGKKAEIAVRQVIHGEPVPSESALANPECLAAFRDLPSLAR